MSTEESLVERKIHRLQTIANDGERAVADNTWSFWTHLSIYHFALPYTTGKRVLDAGSGSGYGSAYLARHGARVLAFDASADAVAHARETYAGDPVTYEVADFNKPLPVGDAIFDTVFSSNVFEHVANIDGLVAQCARVVKPDGVVVVAVPPIISAAVMEADMRNQFHVHHFPPTAWHAKLGRFFGSVQCHQHLGAGIYADGPRMQQEVNAPPHQVVIRETDFAFPETTSRELDATAGITAVFVCRSPRAQPRPESIIERTPAAWCESAIAAKIIGEGAKLAVQLAATESRAKAILAQASLSSSTEGSASVTALQAQIAALRSSTSWRVTAPLRAVRKFFG